VWVCAATAAAQAGPAGSPEEALEQIREQTLYANYREALAAGAAYLERDDLDAAQRNAGLETLATIHIALRHDDEAMTVLEQLYARDPGHRLSDAEASPPVLSAFGRAREQAGDPVGVVMADATEPAERRAPPHVRVTVPEGLDAVAEVRLAYRQGEGGFQTVVMRLDGGSADARVPLLEVSAGYAMSYYVEARAPSGFVLATVGSAGSPVEFQVPEAPPLTGAGPREESVVAADEGDDGVLIAIAVIVGALVAGGAVVTGVLVASDGGPNDGSLGNIQLPIVRF